MAPIDLITVTGPTASGKTRFAALLASKLHGEIISADSRQVYRQMDIGTGKDLEDYMVDGQTVPTHLLDIRPPGDKYNVYEFQEDFVKAYEDIHQRKKTPLLVGGTGMYIEAVLAGYALAKVPVNDRLRASLEPKSQVELVEILKSYATPLHNTTDLTHRKRTIRAIEIADYGTKQPVDKASLPGIRSIILAILYDRESRRRRISERLHHRINNGLIEEVRTLLQKVPSQTLIYYGLEYKFVTMFLCGTLSREEMIEKLEIAIHQFAKRQMTWFRKMERSGYKIHWIDGQASENEKLNRATEILLKAGISLS
jgi:tRNA dimethylallyltransferase